MTTLRKISLLSALLLLAAPMAASAATITVRATPSHIGVGDTVRVDVLLDSAIATNAFSGTLSYSPLLEPVAVSDGNSIISLWVTHPAVSAAGAPISFAGITPGGFSGDGGILFSVLFKTTAAGTAAVSLGSDIQVLRNDGAGSKEPVTLNQLSLSVNPQSSGGYAEPADRTPPEPFTIALSSDPQLSGGRYYAAFMAVDKNSGIDHYEVAESRLPSFVFRLFPLSWKTVASPYTLADQNLTSTIYLKAVDRAGNERLSVFPPQHLLSGYEKYALLGILVVVFLLWYIGWGRRS